MKQKIIGYVDLCDEEVKRIKCISFNNGIGFEMIDTQTKSVAKFTAKKYSKEYGIKYRVYKVFLIEVV